LGIGLYSYHVREILVCLLFFSVLFLFLILLTFGGVLACYTGKYAVHSWIAWQRSNAKRESWKGD
jgi:hypothetical protein